MDDVHELVRGLQQPRPAERIQREFPRSWERASFIRGFDHLAYTFITNISTPPGHNRIACKAAASEWHDEEFYMTGSRYKRMGNGVRAEVAWH